MGFSVNNKLPLCPWKTPKAGQEDKSTGSSEARTSELTKALNHHRVPLLSKGRQVGCKDPEVSQTWSLVSSSSDRHAEEIRCETIHIGPRGGKYREAWRQDFKMMAPVSSRRRKTSLVDCTNEMLWGARNTATRR